MASRVGDDEDASTAAEGLKEVKMRSTAEEDEWKWLEEALMEQYAESNKQQTLHNRSEMNGSKLSPRKNSRQPNIVDDGEEETRWNGWGYRDCNLRVDEDGTVKLLGERYLDIFPRGQRDFPEFADWAESVLGLDLENPAEPLSGPDPQKYPASVKNQGFLDEFIDRNDVDVSEDLMTRVRRSHGQSVQEIYSLRFDPVVPWQIPDLVVFPKSHEAVEAVVKAAVNHDCVLVPVGGCSSVTQALRVPQANGSLNNLNRRCIVSLDMRKMNNILWVDRNNMSACIEAGAYGRDIEEKLGRLGLTLGHEPDSLEFSTLGGWVATKSSGMKKNTYGNIEDIVLNIKLVTPGMGTLTRESVFERDSIGPDPVKLAIGSEGVLGVVTEIVVRLRLRPSQKLFDSYVFGSFRDGQGAMREIALLRAAPSSVRLMDNAQFKMGQALKGPTPPGKISSLIDKAKKFYVLEYHKLDPDHMCAMTLLFEGYDAAQVRESMRQVDSICKRYGGIRAGAESAHRGYNLTWMIAYLRDFGLDFGFISESFETTVPWSQVSQLYDRVCERIRVEAGAAGLVAAPLVGGRITQTYDTCCAMYFYFGINVNDIASLSTPIEVFSRIEDSAREEVLRAGGSLSHHHGVGKVRLPFYQQVTSSAQRELLHAIKKIMDPQNILAAGNLFTAAATSGSTMLEGRL